MFFENRKLDVTFGEKPENRKNRGETEKNEEQSVFY
jgi:hypothetical protein